MSVQWWQYDGLWKVFLVKKCPWPTSSSMVTSLASCAGGSMMGGTGPGQLFRGGLSDCALPGGRALVLVLVVVLLGFRQSSLVRSEAHPPAAAAAAAAIPRSQPLYVPREPAKCARWAQSTSSPPCLLRTGGCDLATRHRHNSTVLLDRTDVLSWLLLLLCLLLWLLLL